MNFLDLLVRKLLGESLARRTLVAEVLGLGLWIVSGTALAVDPGTRVSGSSELAASLFAGLLQNNQALESYDLVYESQFMVNHSIASIKTAETKVRYLSSLIDGRSLFARSMLVDATDPNGQLRSSNRLSATYSDSTLTA